MQALQETSFSATLTAVFVLNSRWWVPLLGWANGTRADLRPQAAPSVSTISTISIYNIYRQYLQFYHQYLGMTFVSLLLQLVSAKVSISNLRNFGNFVYDHQSLASAAAANQCRP